MALFTVKLAAAATLNFTCIAPVRFVPVMTTLVPATPEVGAKLEIVGAVGGGGVLFEAALPQAAITSASDAQSSARAHWRTRPVELKPAKPLLTKDKELGSVALSAAVSMDYC